MSLRGNDNFSHMTIHSWWYNRASLMLPYLLSKRTPGITMERGRGGPHLVRVVHAHSTATAGEVVHLPLFALAAVGGGEGHLEFARLVDDKVCCLVLYRTRRKYNITISRET